MIMYLKEHVTTSAVKGFNQRYLSFILHINDNKEQIESFHTHIAYTI